METEDSEEMKHDGETNDGSSSNDDFPEDSTLNERSLRNKLKTFIYMERKKAAS